MKKLLITIGWLELARIKNRSWLLLIILLAFSLSLTTCGKVNVNISMSSQTSYSSQHEQSGVPAQKKHKPVNSTAALMEAAPVVIMLCGALILGFIVLMTIPIRGKQEWENGQFQMIAMGDYSLYKVELARLLSYLSIAAIFYVCINLCVSVYIWKYEVLPSEFIVNLQGLMMYWFMALLPIMLAFGVFVSAINTAYYRDGNKKLLSFMKYVSCCSFVLLIGNLAYWFTDPMHNLLSPSKMIFDVPSVTQVTIGLSWEFLCLSLIIAGLFVFWSGRVLEEVEA